MGERHKGSQTAAEGQEEHVEAEGVSRAGTPVQAAANSQQEGARAGPARRVLAGGRLLGGRHGNGNGPREGRREPGRSHTRQKSGPCQKKTVDVHNNGGVQAQQTTQRCLAIGGERNRRRGVWMGNRAGKRRGERSRRRRSSAGEKNGRHKRRGDGRARESARARKGRDETGLRALGCWDGEPKRRFRVWAEATVALPLFLPPDCALSLNRPPGPTASSA